MGTGYKQIATKSDANQIHTTSGWANNKKCPTKSELVNAGFTVSGIYQNNRLVRYSDISYSSGTWIEVVPYGLEFYSDYYSVYLLSGTTAKFIDHLDNDNENQLGSGDIDVDPLHPDSWVAADPFNVKFNSSNMLNFTIDLQLDGYDNERLPAGVNNFYITYQFKDNGTVYYGTWTRVMVIQNNGLLSKDFIGINKNDVSYIKMMVHFNRLN